MSSPASPGFCAWCGTPIPYEPHEHEPRYAALTDVARERGEEPPPLPGRVQDVLAGDSFVGVCPGCRRVTHVVGHRAR